MKHKVLKMISQQLTVRKLAKHKYLADHKENFKVNRYWCV